MKKSVLIPFIVIFIYGCQRKEGPVVVQDFSYFDIKSYMNREAARLQKNNKPITKTVEVDGSSETKQLKISDWKLELSIFSDAEINRDSWKGFFNVEKEGNTVTYNSNNEKVPIKTVKVIYNNKDVKGIVIVVKNKNMLYTSIDSLSYFTDSIYLVKKQQNIRFLAKKTYMIKGKLSK
ncbi:hypothetical protein ACVWYN_001949 [Pedobacter sp. UYP24]